MAAKTQTLREYLDELNVSPGSNAGFAIIHENVEMQVSRRYLESAPMQRYLDMKIAHIKYPYVNIYGIATVLFFLAEE